jgi:RecA/RadA recombinase
MLMSKEESSNKQQTNPLQSMDALVAKMNAAAAKKNLPVCVHKAADLDLKPRYITTGNPILDVALGGGWAVGHMSHMYGSEGVGKTFTALQTIAEQTKQGKIGVYWATEEVPSEDMLRLAGVDTRYLYIVEPQDYAETAIDIIEAFLYDEDKKMPRNLVSVLVVDSINNIFGKKERDKLIKEGAEGQNMAVAAGIVTNFIRRLQGRGMMKDLVVLPISQYRANMTPNSHVPFSMSGGYAIKYGPKVTVRLHRAGEQLTATKDRVSSHTVKVVVEKNNITGYKPITEYTVLRPDAEGQGAGLDDSGRLQQLGEEYGYVVPDKDAGRGWYRVILPGGDLVIKGKKDIALTLKANPEIQQELRSLIRGGRPKAAPVSTGVVRNLAPVEEDVENEGEGEGESVVDAGEQSG